MLTCTSRSARLNPVPEMLETFWPSLSLAQPVFIRADIGCPTCEHSANSDVILPSSSKSHISNEKSAEYCVMADQQSTLV